MDIFGPPNQPSRFGYLAGNWLRKAAQNARGLAGGKSWGQGWIHGLQRSPRCAWATWRKQQSRGLGCWIFGPKLAGLVLEGIARAWRQLELHAGWAGVTGWRESRALDLRWLDWQLGWTDSRGLGLVHVERTAGLDFRGPDGRLGWSAAGGWKHGPGFAGLRCLGCGRGEKKRKEKEEEEGKKIKQINK